MGLRLLLDEDVPVLLAEVLRERGYDVLHATEAGVGATPDADVFRWAIGEERALLTHNVRHFMPLTDRLASEGSDHSGLLLAPQLRFGELLQRALRALRGRTQESLINAVVWLE